MHFAVGEVQAKPVRCVRSSITDVLVHIRRAADVFGRAPDDLLRYTQQSRYILTCVGKHLVDIDEQALQAARAELGTDTIKATVNRALHRAGGDRDSRLKERLDLLARADLARREDAWR
jgi:Arc/MetJ family transcription regulator